MLMLYPPGSQIILCDCGDFILGPHNTSFVHFDPRPLLTTKSAKLGALKKGLLVVFSNNGRIRNGIKIENLGISFMNGKSSW